jgi:hypothetical protein
MSEVIFDEDRTILKPIQPKIDIPTTGLEGWFYKRMPGSYGFKRALLLTIIFALFTISFVLFALSRLNGQSARESFEERVEQNQI